MCRTHMQKSPIHNNVKIYKYAYYRSRVEVPGHDWAISGGFMEGMVPELAPKDTCMRNKGNEDDNKSNRLDTSQM